MPIFYRDSISTFEQVQGQLQLNPESFQDVMKPKFSFEEIVSFIDYDDDEDLPNLTEELYEEISRETGSDLDIKPNI